MASITLTGCREYYAQMPTDVAEFICGYKNVVNDQVARISCIQIWHSTIETEKHIRMVAQRELWDMKNMTCDQVVRMRFEAANALYAGRWGNATSYRHCFSFNKGSESTTLKVDFMGRPLARVCRCK